MADMTTEELAAALTGIMMSFHTGLPEVMSSIVDDLSEKDAKDLVCFTAGGAYSLLYRIATLTDQNLDDMLKEMGVWGLNVENMNEE